MNTLTDQEKALLLNIMHKSLKNIFRNIYETENERHNANHRIHTKKERFLCKLKNFTNFPEKGMNYFINNFFSQLDNYSISLDEISLIQKIISKASVYWFDVRNLLILSIVAYQKDVQTEETQES